MQRQTALELLDGGQVVGPRRRTLQLRSAGAVLASNDVVDIGRRRWHAAARATRQVGSTAESGQEAIHATRRCRELSRAMSITKPFTFVCARCACVKSRPLVCETRVCQRHAPVHAVTEP